MHALRHIRDRRQGPESSAAGAAAGGAGTGAPHAGHLAPKFLTQIPQIPLSATGAAAGELALVPPMLGTLQRLLNRDHKAVYFQVPLNP